MIARDSNVIHLPDIVGRSVGRFWKFRGRYTAWKGSRGSKKSKTTALWFIYSIMKYPLAHGLIIRRYMNTHKDSTYSDLQWAAKRLKVSHLWHFPKGEVIATYKVTGQKILFRGVDDVDSITSISVPFGAICFVWFEEAFQIEREDIFDKIDESIRGGFIDHNGNEIGLPDGYFRRIILTFNPWSEKTWIKRRFFDRVDDEILTLTTTYLDNEWLLESDYKLFDRMKRDNPRRYQIAGLGNWGISEGLIFENYIVTEFDPASIEYEMNVMDRLVNKSRFGMDFGYTNDPTAFIAVLISEEKRRIWVYDEIYETGLKNLDIIKLLVYKGYDNRWIKADSADPKSIDTLRDGIYDRDGMLYSLPRIEGAEKGKGSILAGIQKLQDYEIIIHPRCQNFIVEISNYCWKRDNKSDKIMNEPIDEYNHLMDALRYATEDIGRDSFSFDEPS